MPAAYSYVKNNARERKMKMRLLPQIHIVVIQSG